MVYYKATNRFIWFTTNPQTGLDGLLTDLHIGLNSLLQIHKLVLMFTTNPQTGLDGLLTDLQTGLSGLLTDLHTGLDGVLTDLHTGLTGLLQNHKPV